MTRRRSILALVVALVVTLGVALAISSRGQPPERSSAAGVTATDIRLAERDGRAACAHYATALRLIDDNGSADAVRSALTAAVERANDAAERDPAWRPLSSGLGAVRVAVERDDPDAARLGVRVVRAACADVDGRDPR